MCGSPLHSQISADDLLHDLAGTGEDRCGADVAKGPGDRVLVHVPVTAEQLEALVHRLLALFREEVLGHSRLGHHIRLRKPKIQIWFLDSGQDGVLFDKMLTD